MPVHFGPNQPIHHVVLPGTEREPMPESRRIGPSDPHQVIDVTVSVREGKPGAVDDAYQAMAQTPHAQRAYLDHAQAEQQLGADPDDLDDIDAFAAHYNLTVVARHPLQQRVVLHGRIADFQQAFKVRLFDYHHPTGPYRSRTGSISVPDQLKGVITNVAGFDTRPRRRAGYRGPAWSATPSAAAVAGGVLVGDHSGVQLAQRYNFPAASGATALDGKGQTIAVIELGGGYIQSDLDTYFAQIGVPSPTVVWVSVDGAVNQPTPGQNSADGEVMLDIEVIGAVVPAARQVVYFGRAQGPGLFNAVSAAMADAQRKPKVISISWGMAELYETKASRDAWDTLLKKAALLGITVCAATGDHGSNDIDPERDDYHAGALNVDSPACYEATLACGGTMITPAGEQAWNEHNGWAGGGGVSRHMKRPAYQANAGVPKAPNNFVGRGVPDVAATATGYFVRVRGQYAVSGGTSAVAPLWAALVARLAQAKGRPMGLMQPILYAHPNVLTDIAAGNNDLQAGGAHYPAKAGAWDAATGLGVPNGAAILGVV